MKNKDTIILNIPDAPYVSIHITGLVQGVGFRPFVYRMAMKHGVKGSVDNRTDGVFILVENFRGISDFIRDIQINAPQASEIHAISVEGVFTHQQYHDFSIIKSTDASDAITEVSPDIAVCDDCLQDMKQQKHRIAYPFINCTNCGPRFTIIKALPYDREQTTMNEFRMCDTCRSEYADVADRRFHAQPVACNNCGPKYAMHHDGNIIHNHAEILKRATDVLLDGKILAIKGMGGYFIACNALDEEAVNRLRKKKNRDAKPFAVMFRDLAHVKNFVELSVPEEELLSSWRRPIVLLKQRNPLAASVNYNLDKLGVMLPYMPFHYQLFDNSGLEALVMTSGNISDEPIIIDDALALKTLSNIADAVITYNREIYMRCDDSVAFVSHGATQLIRRSRGYVPAQIHTHFEVDGILATGAELKNTFCLGKHQTAILSQHIGDLKNAETLDFYEESIERFAKLFRCQPTTVVSDLHPDYLSTKYAHKSGLNHIQVQHHHAHIASCMAENNINEKVIGVSLDGVGYGTDSAVWGGEFMVCDYTSFERHSHFDYVPMPGGDKASKEPWRMAVAYLYHYLGDDFLKLDIAFVHQLDISKTKLLMQAITSKMNTPMTSSCGRLFDAVAAICGICMHQGYEAQAAMQFESLIQEDCTESYDFQSGEIVSFEQTILDILQDLQQEVPLGIIAARFHNTLANAIAATVTTIHQQTDIHLVALSGGCFQNKYLLEQTVKLLSDKQFKVLIHEKVPANDGGIALGQLAIASHLR